MKRWQIVLLAIGSAIIGGLVVFALLRGGADKDEGDPEDQPVAPAARRVSVVNGVPVVTLDAATIARSGIVVAPVVPSQHTTGSTAMATAVDVRDLVDARSQFENARAQEAQSRARLAAAEAEYARLRMLHDDDRNVSDRVLQEAEANVRAEQAGVAAAAASAQAAMSSVGQRWGATVSSAFAANAPWVNDLIANRKVLIEVSSPAAPPARIDLQTPSGAKVPATFLSPSPRTDPRVQGRVWLYLAPAGDVVPGMTVTAILGSSAMSGVEVPHDAVVWTSGRSWVYVDRGSNQFSRVAIDASTPTQGGYFTTQLPASARIVVAGAQQLLSEEAQPKVED